ncbi:MAG: thiamine-phosphate kinase [Thermodesulfobacteriota bacterium]
MKVSDVGEEGLIQLLSREFTYDDPRLVEGIGDDTSVTLQDGDKCLLTTTDVLVEDVHFSSTYTEPELLGRKAVSTSLSDIAAMGGSPTFLLISLSIPRGTSMEYLRAFYRGARERMDEFGVALIGGNTSSSPGGMTVNVVALGEVPINEVVLRKGAAPGDIIYVTGCIGDSALGLELLQAGAVQMADTVRNSAVMGHLDPTPRVRAGRAIAERRLATAMIDVSDGLLRDLRHITEASSCGAAITLSDLPLSPQLREHLAAKPDDIRLPLAGGEDYELLFTSPIERATSIKALAEEIALPITPIGTIVSKERGVTVLNENGEVTPIQADGFDHFP